MTGKHTFWSDPRPKCVLLVGDGFTQGFVNDEDLGDRIDTRTESLLPPPEYVTYVPEPDDRFGPGPLWRRELFPLLWDAWHAWTATGKSGFRQYCSELRPLNPDRDKGLWTVDSATAAHQLRAYLWHLFRYYDRVIDEHCKVQPIRTWEWPQCLGFLFRNFKTVGISYNYDVLLERCVAGFHGVKVGSYVDSPPLEVLARGMPAEGFFCLKPHGSLGHVSVPQLFGGSNLWLANFHFDRCMLVGMRTRFDLALENCPALPDLVPPGQDYRDLCDPDSRVQEAAKLFVGNCHLLIVCGLSGCAPDDKEIAGLLEQTNRNCAVVHIGLAARNDYDTPVGQHLRSHVDHYEFIDASELRKMVRILKDHFEKRPHSRG